MNEHGVLIIGIIVLITVSLYIIVQMFRRCPLIRDIKIFIFGFLPPVALFFGGIALQSDLIYQLGLVIAFFPALIFLITAGYQLNDDEHKRRFTLAVAMWFALLMMILLSLMNGYMLTRTFTNIS